ncbi:MAG: pyridoxamine 5'-phosphate oxidase family protein [Spirochaetia bacterium]|jgi:pyridoxamine 5'-phosphate oxidase|nr:pyridoxamine 5'-phosphate oxidase family protein [Spirochaetales bacterium]
MTKQEVLNTLEMILNEAHTAVLATTDQDGKPHIRWMTPALLRGRTGVIYAVTSPRFGKVVQLEAHPEVEWMFQTPILDTIVTVRGRINIVDNPSILSEVLETLGSFMRSFWKLKGDERGLLVLETIIEEAIYYKPMKGVKEVVGNWKKGT